MKLFIILLLSVVFLFGQQLHPDLEALGVDEHYDKLVPLSLRFINEEGEKVTLDKYFSKIKPVLFNFVYYNCTATCNQLLHGVSKAVADLDGLKVGKDFEIVTLSIDSREGYQMAKAKKKNYLEQYSLESIDRGWHYLTGEDNQIRPLANALGFKYKWSAKQEQFLHPSVIFILTPKGKISRYLYGVEYNEADLKLSLIEASSGKIGTTFDKILLLCYTFDPTKGQYTKNALTIMSFAGLLTLLFVGMFLAYFWKKELKNKNKIVKEL